MSLNTITIMGRLTREVDLRNTTNGTSVADFCLAVDRDRKNSNGDREADFIDCVAWGKTAEFADRNLSKGQKVVVCGRLQVDRWIDQEGKNRRNYKVSVQTIYFADAGRKSEECNYTTRAQKTAPGLSGYATVDNNGSHAVGYDTIVDPYFDDGQVPF